MHLCKIKYGLFFLCILFTSGLSAQDVRADLEKMRGLYQQTAFEAQLSYKLYASYEAKSPFEIQEGTIRSNTKAYYRKLGKVESLFHPDYALMVDHESRLLLIQPAIEMSLGNHILPPLDSTLEKIDDIVFETVNAKQNAYLFSFESDQYKQVKLIFDKNTYQLDRIIYYMQPGMVVDEHVKPGQAVRLEMSLSHQHFQPEFSSLAFSALQYLQKITDEQEGEAFRPLPAFRQYQFVNYLP